MLSSIRNARGIAVMVATILVVASLETGSVQCQQVTDALTSLLGGLRGTLNSLLGGSSGGGGMNMPQQGMPQAPPNFWNQLLGYGQRLPQPNGGGFQQQGQPIWPQGG